MITVRELRYEDRERYDQLEGEYHYMGESHGAGDTIRLIFEEDGKWIALQTWAAACYALKSRDERIGWNPVMRASRLKLIVNNRRFTITAEKGSRPNLASQLLGLAVRELPAIWEKKWGYRPLLAETFCDIERTAGTCYRAAGWEEVGKTKGFSRHARDFFIPNDRPKVLFMKPFVKDAWELIVSNSLPYEYEKVAHSKSDGLLPFKPKQIDSLYEKLCQVVDPRARNRKIHIGFLLTAYTMGMAAGAKDLKAAIAYARRLSQKQLKAIGCPNAMDVCGDDIPNQYAVPSYTAFYYLLKKLDMKEYAKKLSEWTTEQEGMLPRHLTIDGKFVKEICGIVSIVDADTGSVVSVAPCSRKEGLAGECEYPVVNRMLASADLSNATVSADALSCHPETAQTVLAQGGDYVLQLKGETRSVKKNADAICKSRNPVSTFVKKTS